jgi:hypothetical protein
MFTAIENHIKSPVRCSQSVASIQEPRVIRADDSDWPDHNQPFCTVLQTEPRPEDAREGGNSSDGPESR